MWHWRPFLQCDRRDRRDAGRTLPVSRPGSRKTRARSVGRHSARSGKIYGGKSSRGRTPDSTEARRTWLSGAGMSAATALPSGDQWKDPFYVAAWKRGRRIEINEKWRKNFPSLLAGTALAATFH